MADQFDEMRSRFDAASRFGDMLRQAFEKETEARQQMLAAFLAGEDGASCCLACREMIFPAETFHCGRERCGALLGDPEKAITSRATIEEAAKRAAACGMGVVQTIDHEAHLLELEAIACDGPPSKCTGECRGKTREEHWDHGDTESEPIICRFCGEDG